MSDDVLITPGSRKIEFKDSSANVDAKIETDSSGNLIITNTGGDITIGDTTSDIFVGDGTANVDIVFEQAGEIRGTTGVTVTLGAADSNIRMATDLNLNSNDITNVGDLTVTGNLTITGDINSYNVTDLDVADKTITVGAGQTEANSGGSGLIVDGSSASLLWDEGDNRFEFNKNIYAPVIYGSGAGITSLNGSNISSGTVAAARIASLAASKITSGTFADARISSSSVTQHLGSYLTGNQTITLSGDVSGSGTTSIAVTVDNYILNDQYATVGSRYSGNGSDLSSPSKASIRLWDVSEGNDEPSGASDGLVYTAGWDSTSWAVQQFHDFHSNDFYLRSKQNGTWMSTWDRVFHDTYHPNADTLTTARTISLGGDLSGSASFNGSANITITAAVANDSHTHTFNNLTGKTSATGEYSTSGYLTAGRGSGGVSLTHNDGYGNANVTFNHKAGVPEQAGNCGRIVVNTDSTTGAQMYFELVSNSGTSAINTPSAMELTESGMYIPNYLYHLGDTDTYLKFDTNRIRLYAGGSVKFDSNNTYLTGNQTITLSGDVSGSGTTSINVTVADDSHNHVISNVDGLQTALDAKLTSSSGLNASNLTSGTVPSARLATSSSGDWWSGDVVKVGTDGVSEVGKYLDFHNTDAGTTDFDSRLYSSGTNQLTINGSGRIFTDGYHPNADTLTTARTIAGTSFNGSANIDISYNNLTNKPTIPTNNNQLTNGAGYITGSSTSLDSRYYTESEMQTYFKRGYIEAQTANALAVGWYTVATNTGDRAIGDFTLWDTDSSDHQGISFKASHFYGTDNSNDITVLHYARYSGSPIRYIRIKDGDTYDGAALQVYIDQASNNVGIAITGGNPPISGWVLKDWIPDATDPGSLSNYGSFGERVRVDLDLISNGGQQTSGAVVVGNPSNVLTDTNIAVYNNHTGDAKHYQIYHGTTRVGEIGARDTTWLRINDDTAKNIYTPRYIRADGGFFVDSTSKGINGSGNFIGGTITGASDANVSNWDTAYGWGNHASQSYATQSYVGTQISNLVDSSPSALNTLNELAAALGDDANFSTTVTNSIATKLPLAGGTMTGDLEVGGSIQATSTGTATLILRGDSNNSGDTGQLDSTIKMLHDDGQHGILMETKNYAGKQSFEIKSITGGTESSRFLIHEDNYIVTSGDIHIPSKIQHVGDTNTYIQFDTDRVRIYAGGSSKFDSNNTYLTGNQTITLTGDVSGSGTTSIAVTVADDSHNHVISNVDGLQTALDAKLPLAGGTMTGTLNMGGNAFTGNNFNISGVNQITLNDPGEGIVFGSNCNLYLLDDAADNILRLDAPGGFRLHNGPLSIGTTTVIDTSRNLTNIGTISSGAITANAGTGVSSFYASHTTSHDDWQVSPISIEERGLIGSGSTSNSYSPNLNFHWNAVVSRSLTMTNDGNFTLGEWTSSGSPSLTGSLSFLNTAGYRVNNTTVIDSSRNLTNIGTISSGTIGVNELSPLTPVHVTVSSSASALTLQNTTGGAGANVGLDFITYNDGLSGYANPGARISGVDDGAYGANLTFYGKANAIGGALSAIVTIKAKGDLQINSGDLQIGSTTVIDSSRNLTNIGTISSGAITATNTGNAIVAKYNASNYSALRYDGVDTVSGGDGVYKRAGSEKLRLKTSGVDVTGTITSSGNLIISDTGFIRAQNTTKGRIKFDAGLDGGVKLLQGSNELAEFALNSGPMRLTFQPSQGEHMFIRHENTNTNVCEIAFHFDNDGTQTESQRFVSDGTIHADGDVIAYSTQTSSDIRLKENVRPLEGSLDKVLNLRGVQFDWKEEKRPNDQLGFIAQEVEEVLPEIVKETVTLSEEGKTHKTVNYEAVIPVLVEAIKEQQHKINELQEQVQNLKEK